MNFPDSLILEYGIDHYSGESFWDAASTEKRNGDVTVYSSDEMVT